MERVLRFSFVNSLKVSLHSIRAVVTFPRYSRSDIRCVGVPDVRKKNSLRFCRIKKSSATVSQPLRTLSATLRRTKAPPRGRKCCHYRMQKKRYDKESDGRCEMSGFLLKGLALALVHVTTANCQDPEKRKFVR